jgi:membrane-associated phospholipid phosphatase
MHRDLSVHRMAALRLALAAIFCLGTVCVSAAQESTFDAPAPDAEAACPASQPQNAVPNQFQDVDISWRKLPKRGLHDQKDIWLFPTQLARGHYWAPTLGVVGGTAGLIVADPHAMPYFRTHAGNLDDLNDTFDGTITSAGIALVPLSILASGYLRHNPYDVKTSLLAGEAYVDGAILDLALKAVTRRKRPSDVPAGTPFNDTFFSGGKSPFKGSSFPSGHAIGAFSVATVIAHRYSQHRWVPWVAYGLATGVSLSRISTSAHFPSDVFLGAALGYTITRFEVLRR